MSARSFGLIGASIWHSRAFNALGSDSAKLAFIYIITTDHGNRIGTYRLNPSYMAADRLITPAKAENDLMDMWQAGLIDYDSENQVIHIRKFFRRNPITNRNHLQGSLRMLDTLPQQSVMVGMAASDIIVCAFEVSDGWSDLDAMIKMRQMALDKCQRLVIKHNAVNYLEALLRDLPEPLSIALLEHLSIPLRKALSIPLSIPLSNEGDGDGDSDSDGEGEGDSDGEGDTDGEGEGEGEKKERARNRKPRKAGAASASERAAPASRNQRQGAALDAMAENVKDVASGKRNPSVILQPTAGQLDTMVKSKRITAKQRDQFLSKVKR